MDENQKLALFRAIAISTASSPALMPLITQQSRTEAFITLEEFKKFPSRAAVVLELLQTETHLLPFNGTSVDITASTKLYVLTVLQSFLKTDYAKLTNENDRLSIRNAILVAAKQLLAQSSSPTSSISENENRFLAVKIAALIADVAIRDFPQRWTTFITDLFSPTDKGGLWFVSPPEAAPTVGYGPMIGVKICLECLKIITEDCTDADFNSKVSTSRRNDVVLGLNEVNEHFLKLMFDLLSNQYAILNSAKAALTEMHNYLISNSRTVGQMTPQEKPMYDEQVQRKKNAARIVMDCLNTLKMFCHSMPIEWMMENTEQHDFIAACLHLLREDTGVDSSQTLQIKAVGCLQQIIQRKIETKDWLRIVQALPPAITEADEAVTSQEQIQAMAEGRAAVDAQKSLVDKLPFHRALSKLLAQTISGHVAHITNDRRLMEYASSNNGVSGGGGSGPPNFEIVSAFLNLLAEMLSHPCPLVCSEQNNMWMVLLRDPQIAKMGTKLLQPCMERILTSYMSHVVRIRWSDVEDQIHPYAQLMEEAFDDKEAYETFVGDFRSKANSIFRGVSAIEPKIATVVVHQKMKYLFSTYAIGSVRDHLNPSTGQLTQQSTAVVEFEGTHIPLDNLIHGLPDWALDDGKTNDPSFMDPNRVQIRNDVRAMIGEIASLVVEWNPTESWLKFRKVVLVESLKFYWEYDAPRLITAIGALLQSIGEENGNGSGRPSDDIISLRKRSGSALIAVTKRVKSLLVGYIGQLSERVKSLLSKESMSPSNRMQLYEFLSCVATAVEDPNARSTFVGNVLSGALNNLDLPLIQEALASQDGMLSFMGILQAEADPSSVTDKANVERVTNNYITLFSCFNQLLSVGKRCHEAARKRPNAGIPLPDHQILAELQQNQHNFPDEGAVSLNDLTVNDPFVHLWPRILPALTKCLDVLFTIWQPANHAKYLKNPIQRYAFAISDDEAYLAKKSGTSSGGVFGEGGTAGSVVSGWDRRGCNLAPKWSGWFNELRNTCLQLLGLICAQRALYAPEISSFYQNFVNVIANPDHLRAMENRHMTQYIKQFIDYLLLSCPSTLYQSHIAPIAAPFFEHMEFRLKCTWAPVLKMEGVSPESTKPLTTGDCDRVIDAALTGGEAWFVPYYARGGIFVGDLDAVTSEAMVEKSRVEVSRSFADMLQTALALKGDWALVLANIAREEQAAKRNDSSILRTAPSTKGARSTGPLNADGTKRSKLHIAIEARKLQRIQKLCHFLLLENETIAGYLVLSVLECLNYPDAYTCRRCTKLCHRILETVAWVDRYTQLLGSQMFTNAVKAVVYEKKWMVGIEWDMINLIRDIYCRLVIGQSIQFGGQGAAMQAPTDSLGRFEQTKTANNPLQGGGILVSTSDLPRQVLAALPGIDPNMVLELEASLKTKRSAKDQKDSLKDLLRIAADNLKIAEGDGQDSGILGRANASESLLTQKQSNVVQAIPEKLVTHKMMMKQHEKDLSAQENPPVFQF